MAKGAGASMPSHWSPSSSPRRRPVENTRRACACRLSLQLPDHQAKRAALRLLDYQIAQQAEDHCLAPLL